jgi:geranylgeranyl pyrophosphate synthase
MNRMTKTYTIRKRCLKILEDNGGAVANETRKILLEDPELINLRPGLLFISKNWRDPLTPTCMSLSCEAVGGHPKETSKAAIALSLMNLSFYVWDDLLDKSQHKLFKPTFFGKFGEGSALVIGGLASAKAFSILNELEMHEEKRRALNKLFWGLWARMAYAETSTFQSQRNGDPSSKEKLRKIEIESIAMENCMRIGAIIGNGSTSEINHLGEYGQCLGVILELEKDFQVSVNLTLEMIAKIRSGTMPYALLWAIEQSPKVRKKIDLISETNVIGQPIVKDVVEAVLEAKALDNTVKIIEGCIKQGKKEVGELKRNRATRMLQLFIEDQLPLFIGNLSSIAETSDLK